MLCSTYLYDKLRGLPGDALDHKAKIEVAKKCIKCLYIKISILLSLSTAFHPYLPHTPYFFVFSTSFFSPPLIHLYPDHSSLTL